MKIAGTVSEGDEVAGFKVLHFPGHAPGLIGLWRESDRVALVSDVVYLVDSARLKPLPHGEASVPHPAFAWNHQEAKRSLRRLAELEPLVVGAGHERPLRGDDLRAVLEAGRREVLSGAPAGPRALAHRIRRPAAIGLPADDRDLRLGGADLPGLAPGRQGDLLARRAARVVLARAGAVGFAAILTVSGILARAPGHGTSATLGIVVLIVVAAVVAWRREYAAPGALGVGLATAVVVAIVLSFPFAVTGRWGLLGVGFNNDLGLHLAWAEWLRSGVGPEPDPGYPLGPHGLAVATAAFPGISLGQAFIGEIFAIGILTGLTALGALREIAAWRRVVGATLVAVTYMAASYFAQAAFKETAEALFVLAVAIYLMRARGAAARALAAGRLGAPLGRPRRRRLLLLLVRRDRLAGRDRRRLGAGPARDLAGAAPGAGAADRAAALGAARHPRPRRAGDRADGHRAVRLRLELQRSRGEQHLRAGLPGRDAGDLAGRQLPPRRRPAARRCPA